MKNSDLGTESSKSERESKIQISVSTYLLSIFIAGIIFFAVGNRSRSVPVPSILKSDRASQNLGSSPDLSGINEIYSNLKNKYDGDLTDPEVNTGIKRGIVQATGDPYSSYFTKDEYQKFNSDLQGKYSGIGAEVGKKGDSVEIITPLDGSPAVKAGLQPGDLITEVDDYKITAESTLQEVVDKIKGEAGTTVKLKVYRSEIGEKDYTITRDTIQDKSVKYEIKDGIAFIRISRFASDTNDLIDSAAAEALKQGVQGVILDLRDNGGGELDAAVHVSSKWLNFGQVVVEERTGEKVIRTFKSEQNGELANIKTVVLVNQYSASASEIVTGALKDHGKAKIIGQKTYGKGSVQELVELNDGSALKVTIAKWYTPKGKNIHNEGIDPDQEIKLSWEERKNGTDTQKDAAVNYLNN